MLSILAALLQPSSGQILLDGQDLAGMGDVERVALRREKIGFTFQANNLVPLPERGRKCGIDAAPEQ